MFDPQFIIDETEPEQTNAARGPSADEAREALRKQFDRIIMVDALIWNICCRVEPEKPPPHRAIRITTGVGKSELGRQEIARFVIEAKRDGQMPHRVLVAVPTHKLAGEARSKMPDGVTTAIWQGRDGTHLATGEPMCRNPEAVAAALEIGAEIEETACKNGEARCPFFDSCRYQRQKEPAGKADVVFCAHEILFQVPEKLGEDFGLVFVDEGFWQDGITGTDLAIDRLAHELKDFPVRRGGNRLDTETTHLRERIERLQAALAKMPDGYVTRAPLIEAGLLPATADEESSCTDARKMEWQRKVDHGLMPDASDEDRKAVVKKYGFLAQLPRRAAMWRALGDLIAGSEGASGRLLLDTRTTKSGTVRRLHVQGHKDISETIAGLPLVYADATLPFDLVKCSYLPDLVMACDINVAAPHMRIVQVVGMPVGKAALVPKPPGERKGKTKGAWTETGPEAEERVARKRQRLAAACRHLAQGRRGLVITYKDIEDDFAGIENVEVAHFGAIEGIDRWRDVDVLIIIGRPLPRPDDIERMAAAITGWPVVAGQPVKEDCEIRPGQPIKRLTYATHLAEMVRQAVTEAAIVQAVGRARGVNRTEANPVEVYLILDDTVVPGLEVDEVVDFGDLEPGAIDHMIARGLVLGMPADAAKLYSDLFPSRRAAIQTYRRAGFRMELAPDGRRLDTSLNKNISIKGCIQPPCVALLFQPSGRGQLSRFCIANPAKVTDPRAVLEAALGKLARFEVLSPEQPEAEPKPEPDFPGDRPWPKSDLCPDLKPMSPREWRATALAGLKATF